jgi:hypothetical protein
MRAPYFYPDSGVDALITEEPDDRETWQCLPTVKEPRKRRSFPE